MLTVSVEAEPEELELDLERTAVLVVDMQNAFASSGGMLDLAGLDISGAAEVVEKVGDVAGAARAAGIPVVYLEMGYPADRSTAGGPESPNPAKELSLALARARPELAGQLLTWGSWDYAIVEALEPREGDLVVRKARYSGFAGTDLDSMLRSRNVKYLIFTGIAANVCVESTLREAYFREYWCLLATDATMAAGGKELHAATVFNVSHFFGWVAESDAIVRALRGVASRTARG